MSEKKVHWTIKSVSKKAYSITTWYRAVGVENFVNLVEKKNKIVGIIFDDNNIGFLLDEKEI